MSGFNYLPDRNVTCTLIEKQNAYRIENFESIGPEKRVVVIVDAITPNVAGSYAVHIGTYNGIKNAFIDL